MLKRQLENDLSDYMFGSIGYIPYAYYYEYQPAAAGSFVTIPDSVAFPNLDFQVPQNISPEAVVTWPNLGGPFMPEGWTVNLGDSSQLLQSGSPLSGGGSAGNWLQRFGRWLVTPSTTADNKGRGSGGAGGLFGLDNTPLGSGIDLAARLAPGIAALNFAKHRRAWIPHRFLT